MKEYSTSNRIDEIFAQINAEESARKEKYLLTICGSVLVLFFILISSFILKQPAEPLDIRREQSRLDEISVNDDNASQAASFVFIEDYDEAETTEEQVLEDDGFSEEVKTPHSIDLQIRGDQVTVSEITFEILNFDPEYIYRVDFGNGEGKRIEQTFHYSYLEPGLFDLKIMAYGKDKSKKKLVKKLNIKPWENS